MLYKIIVSVLLVVVGFLSMYFKTKSELKLEACKFINKAEKKYENGSTKFTFVVNSLYDLVPAPLKIVLTKEVIEIIVKSTFHQMELYATKQLNKVSDKIEDRLGDKK